MSERIEVGDLVMVVRECCHHGDSGLGEIHVVLAIRAWPGSRCKNCGFRHDGERATLIQSSPEFHDWALPLSWLKKIIPPLSDPESTQTRDERERETT